MNKEEILQIAKGAINKTIGEIIGNQEIELIKKDKGAIGQAIEQGLFGLKRNNLDKADFAEIGLELKVIPLKRDSKNNLVPKERMVLSIINYEKDFLFKFKESHVYEKNNCILVLAYEHNYIDLNKLNYVIKDAFLLDLNTIEEYQIIEEDYLTLKKMVELGNAHLISESNSNILAACTKGSKGDNFRTQPFSSTPAKQRAFSFKVGFIKKILNSKTRNQHLEYNLFDKIDYIIEKYQNINVIDYYLNHIRKDVTKKIPKNINRIVLDYWMKLEVPNYKKQLQALTCELRTCTVNKDGKIQESLSLNVINPLAIVEDSFEDSSEYLDLFENKFLMFAFKKVDKQHIYLEKMFELEFDKSEYETIQSVWEDTKLKFISDYQETISPNGQVKDNFIKESSNKIIHIRPKGVNKLDQYLIMNNTKSICKKSFWINNKYIQKKYDNSK
ncbi:MutH/Sau3AI family endonuclease [Spiroplasma alleghenense]|uniref:DNA mismatch repair protein MutH n=1 Tax=Spiroplasma alleghenense TaxID=216931 RepID=A0A345Z4U9_9MOLU|nr:MutH/Sau3AI family endonuclease [Spiroplasma alleghenense]AXK51628.1 DNA mismatch repair protein MutH [Spiroplasma alleghenense]